MDALFDSFWFALIVLAIPVAVVLWLMRRPIDQGSVPSDIVATKGRATGGTMGTGGGPADDLLDGTAEEQRHFDEDRAP